MPTSPRHHPDFPLGRALPPLPTAPPLYGVLSAGEWIGDGLFTSLDEAAEAVLGLAEFECREWSTGRDCTADVERRLSRIEAEIFTETQSHRALVRSMEGR